MGLWRRGKGRPKTPRQDEAGAVQEAKSSVKTSQPAPPEECPLFLGNEVRLHCGMSEPASLKGSDEERLTAVRSVRDELRRRITMLLAG